MSDLLIKGMEMPKDDILRIEICPDGQVNRIIGWALSEPKKATAVSLPEHGRLGDLDEISNKLLGKGLTRFFVREKRYLTIGDARRIIENAPVIVEASR